MCDIIHSDIKSSEGKDLWILKNAEEKLIGSIMRY